jgi:predicted component of type VI protein secretion system
MTILRLVPAVGAPLDIQRERTLIGRDPAADLVVNDPSVSRRHAVIEKRAQAWVVVDQRSANGTWVNDTRMDEALLQGGEQLRLGAVCFEVLLPAAAPSRPAGARPPEPAYAPAPPRPPVTAPPATASAQVASPQAGGMAVEEAAEILGLWPGTSADEVRRRYQKMYNDFQIRLTNAPTPSLKRMYQKNIQDLRTACEVLSPGAVG